jgi:hypothetical protein
MCISIALLVQQQRQRDSGISSAQYLPKVGVPNLNISLTVSRQPLSSSLQYSYQAPSTMPRDSQSRFSWRTAIIVGIVLAMSIPWWAETRKNSQNQIVELKLYAPIGKIYRFGKPIFHYGSNTSNVPIDEMWNLRWSKVW